MNTSYVSAFALATIAALFVIQFIYGWNQYLWPLLVTNSEGFYTAVMTVARQATAVAAASEQASTNVQTVAAASEELSREIRDVGLSLERQTRTVREASHGAQELMHELKAKTA